jgi:tRNA-Thr(GGU) m(6)t(6)A37 methyltransferase TsaA
MQDAFAEFERTGWERAAARYEECWTDTALFVEPLLDAAAVRAGSRLLDLACGPGLVSEAAAARGAEPVGVDVAAAMVERARRRCPGLTFVEGDAQRLPFADASFDAVTMNFGILHLSEPEAALAEARRVLVPGGRFAFTAWIDEGNVAAEIVDAAIAEHAVPVDVPDGPGFYAFGDPGAARAALAAAGFEAVRTDTVRPLWRVPTAELLFEAHVDAGVRVSAVLRGQPPDRLEAIRAAIADGVRRHADGPEFVLPIAARLISARVPRLELRPIGVVESPLTDPAAAPKQGFEGGPDAWLVLEPDVLEGLDGIQPGARVIVLTWLDRARRDILRVHPRDDVRNPLQGVFNTRSADRPNPIGLHEVEILAIEGHRVRVSSLEAVDGTPVVDLKPVLS